MMKKILGFVVVVAIFASVFMLNACGSKNDGGSASSDETANGASSSESASDTDEVESQNISGETVEIAVTNSSHEEGTLSALCPDSWNSYSTDEELFFSESDKAGDFSKPYMKISYTTSSLSVGGSGEDVSFTLGGKSWEGLHDDSYGTYNVISLLDDGGLSVISNGVGPDDALYKTVMESIEVNF